MKALLVFLMMASVVAAKEVKLPSGRVVDIRKVGPMVFTSRLPTAWVLLYQTKYPWSAKKEIIAEVDDIWTTFRLEVEKREMKMGIIKVTDAGDGGVVQKRTEINFVFEPEKDGGWKMQLPDAMRDEKKKPNQSPEPTAMLGTSAAEQPLVPSTAVAHL